jgi:uncharacterized protein (DUF1786 family)
VANPRILAVDVGTGTQDILVFEAGTVVENSVQLVMPSPTMLMAERVREATAAGIDLLLTGVTMGGGPVHWAVESHLKGGLKVYATLEAAATFDDDLSRVAAMGVSIVDRSVALRLSGVRRLELRDFYFDAIVDALAAFGVSGDFDAVAVAVFDHGAAPPGYSDRRFRFDYLKRQVESGAGLERFGFLAADIPDRMTRMMAVAESCALKQPLFVMDTGAAAALGALDDPRVRGVDHLLLANIGNFHTLAFLLDRGRIRGLFEHHTGELTKSELESYLDRLAEGRIRNVDVFNDMGHGALELEPVPWKPEVLALTGPRRGMLDGARRQPYLAVPHGNMMIAGCFGLLRGLAAHLPEFAGPINQVLGPPAYRA